MLEVLEVYVRLGDRMVLEDVSFEVPAGQMLCVIGPNGAGKTTLIKALNRTVDLAYHGRVLIDGSDTLLMSRREIAKSIAVVAQENETRFPVTVLEYVLSGRFVHGGAFGWESR